MALKLNGTQPVAGSIATSDGTSLTFTAVGTSGQVLTSAGSGTPIWASASGGGSFTATASGNISAGNPLVLNENGTVSAATGVPIPITLDEKPVLANVDKTMTVYNPAGNNYINILKKYGQLNFEIVNKQGGAITVTSVPYPQAYLPDSAHGKQASNDLVALIQGDLLFVLGNSFDDNYGPPLPTLWIFRINDTVITEASVIKLSNEAFYGSTSKAIAYDSANDQYLIHYGRNYDSTYLRSFTFRLGTGDNAGIWLANLSDPLDIKAADSSWNTHYGITNNVNLFVNAAQNKWILAGIAGSDTDYVIYMGSTVNFNSQTAVTTSIKSTPGNTMTQDTVIYNQKNVGVLFVNDVLIFPTSFTVSDYDLNLAYLNYSSNTATFSDHTIASKIPKPSGPSGNFYFIENLGIFIDPLDGSIKMFTSLNSQNVKKVYVVNIKLAGTGNSTTILSIGNLTEFSEKIIVDIALLLDSASNTTEMLAISVTDGFGIHKNLLIKFPYGNTKTNNFVGFSDENFSNGQTVTVKNLGSVTTTQTGLTINSRYYVFEGSISSTVNSGVSAGKAISSTKLLIGA